jgi:hypothetical protein
MTTITPYVKRHDIRTGEEREFEHSFDGYAHTSTTWKATLYGPLSTGEHVDMSREGATFTEALANLEAAIAENGWEIR